MNTLRTGTMFIISAALAGVGYLIWDGDLFCPGSIYPTPSLVLWAFALLIARYGIAPLGPPPTLLEYSGLMLVCVALLIALYVTGVSDWWESQAAMCAR